MTSLRRASWIFPALAAAAVAGCSADSPGDGGSGSDGEVDGEARDAGAEADAPGDADGGEGGAVGGPSTLVVSELALIEERLCDHDGDGVLDNAVAELGPSAARLFAMGASTYIRGTIEGGENRIVAHAPWVDDLETPHDPEVRLIVFDGLDLDDDPADDFSGDEPFSAAVEYLDPCGEPTRVIEGLSIDHGVARGGSGILPTPLGANVPGLDGQATGTVAPGGAEAELSLCFYVLARDLGASKSGLGDLSFLELFLAGGGALGLPTLPGLRLDLDLDGDGLERFELDVEGRISSCLDGDTTVIDGRDCWLDPRMADGISLALSMSAVSARLEGLEEDWEQWATTTCGGTFLCEHACEGDTCLCPPPCGAATSSYEALEECLARECPEQCGATGERGPCWTCGHVNCPEESAACLAADCCPDPPETSLWDPS